VNPTSNPIQPRHPIPAAAPRPRGLSVSSILAVVLIAIITTIVAAFLAYSNYSDRRQQMFALEKNLFVTVEQASAALYLPVWNVDDAQTNKILDSLMRDVELDAVTLEIQTGSGNSARTTILGRVRNSDGTAGVSNQPFTPDGSQLVQERFVKDTSGEILGTLKVFETKRYMEQRLQKSFMRNLIFMFLLDVLLVGIIYGLLYLIVLRPLKSIEQFALAVQSGPAHPPRVPGVFRGELHSLKLSLENMVALLSTRYADVKKHETMLAAVVNSVPQVVFWKDVNSVYLGCNEKFAHATGLDKPDLVVGKTDYDLPWDRKDIEFYRASDRDVIAGQVHKSLDNVLQADGTRIWTDVTKVPLKDPDSGVFGVLGVYEDVTERISADQQLRRQSAFDALAREILAGLVGSAEQNFDAHFRDSLHRIAQFMGTHLAYIAEYNPARKSWSILHLWFDPKIDGHMLEFRNLAAQGQSAFEKHLLEGETVAVRDLADLPDSAAEMRERFRSAGFAASLHVPLRSSDGRIHGCVGQFTQTPNPAWPAEDLQRIAYLCDALASTLDRMKAERALRESELRFRVLIENAPVAISISRNGYYEYRNPANLRIYGLPPDAATRRESILDRMAPESRPESVEIIARHNKPNAPQQSFEVTGLRADGTEFPLSFVVAQVEVPDGVVNVSFASDLSERKRTEALYLESEKLRSVAGLAAGVAHEINNPLAAMVQNAQVCINRLSDNVPANRVVADRLGLPFDAILSYINQREILESLEAIRVSGRQASRIVQNLLSYSRRDSATTSVNLPRLIDQTLELAASDYELKRPESLGSVELVRDDAAISAVCNASQIQQVLINLIRNAIQAMRDNPEGSHKILRLRTFQKENFACIAVEDTGPGMPESIRQRVFEPFVTTKTTGTGLGLFVCYHIVTVNHAGRLTVESTINHGTTCTIMLPMGKTES
jgi:PAS domain S-box-containing protein